MTKTLPLIYKKYGEISGEDKKTITNMLKLFIKTYFSEFFNSGKQRFASKNEVN